MPRGFRGTGTKQSPRKIGVVTRALLHAGFSRAEFKCEQGRVSPNVVVWLHDVPAFDRAHAAMVAAFPYGTVTGTRSTATVWVRP